MKKNFFAFLALIIFFLVGFFLIKFQTPTQPPPYQGGGAEGRGGQIKFVNIAGQNIKVDLALTQATQAQGLSGRQSLSENEGMLFVFDKPGKYPFWMKDMNFPIDMIWIGENLQVVYIEKDARPESYPESYGPSSDAKYVLEVVSGFS